MALVLTASAALGGCSQGTTTAATDGVATAGAVDAVALESEPTVRQGPFRVICYKDEAVVFEHGTIFRVYRPYGANAGWSYETGDGLKYRGRIGENVNCVWQ